ncbi:hypothetical protein D039_3832A, partial [Vibrio parahaemolyticus EKP-028]
MVSVMSSP